MAKNTLPKEQPLWNVNQIIFYIPTNTDDNHVTMLISPPYLL